MERQPREKTVKIAIDVEPERPQKRKRSPKDQFLYYFRKLVQFFCSYIGLTSVLVGYVFIGALIFKSLEQPEEKYVAHLVELEREYLVKDISVECVRDPANWTETMGRERLLKFEGELTRYITRHGYNRIRPDKWNFFGSLLFSLTVITTIGYGHITPVTWFGRVFCMVYALIGIPLMLLVLTNVGRLLANTAKLLYVAYTSKLCQQSRCYQHHKKRMARSKSSRGKPVKRKPPQKKGTKKGTSKKKASSKKSVKQDPTNNPEENVKRILPKSASDIGPPTSNKVKRKKRPATISTADLKMMDPDKARRLANYDRIDELLRGSPGHSGEEPSSVTSSPARGLTIREAYASRAAKEGSASTPTTPQNDRKSIAMIDEGTKSDTELEIAKSEERTAEAAESREATEEKRDISEEKGDQKIEQIKEIEPGASTSDAKIVTEKQAETELDPDKGSLKRKGKKPNRRSRSETRTSDTKKKDSYRSDSETDSRTGSWQRKRRRRLSSPVTGSRPSSIASIYSLELKVMDATTALKLANYNKPDWSSRDDLDRILNEFSEDERRSRSGDTPVKTKKSPKKPKDHDGEKTKEKPSKEKLNKKSTKKGSKQKLTEEEPEEIGGQVEAEKEKVEVEPESREVETQNEAAAESESKVEDDTAVTEGAASLVVPEREGSVRVNKRNTRKRKSTAKKKSSKREMKVRSKSDPGIAPTQDIEELEADFSDEERVRRRNDEFEVPITPVLVLFLSYIMVGAILFSQLIEEWDIATGIYFCFITLTTIGFGDFVPDDDLYSLIACTLYTMIGMAITSMCIALMIKKFVSSVRKFGRRIGLIKDEDEEHQYEDR
ncbi:transcriptional regulator ATRX homolog [Ptychodera flava]|uniref:transcriptional regulator ATRX homolog n=1 Tax=Ptychodera flava TaxID=63121 RepID=UPI00396AA6A6